MTESKSSSSPGGGGLSQMFNSAMGKISERVPAVNQLQHTLRQQAAIHNPNQNPETLKLQLVIKAGSSCVIDEQALARETKLLSKNLYLWGKGEEKQDDLADVSDRMAYAIYQSAELFDANAKRVDQARAALKDIRNFENELIPKRQKQQALASKLGQLKQSGAAKSDKTATEVSRLSSELAQLETENATFEQSLQSLKRMKLYEFASVYFAAQKELGEKLALVGAYGELLAEGLDGHSLGTAYEGAERTAAIRAELGAELDSWNPALPLIPKPQLKPAGGSSFLGRSDTRSFGHTHEVELSQLGSLNALPSPALADSGHSSGVSPLPTPSASSVAAGRPDVAFASSTSPSDGLPLPLNLSPSLPPSSASPSSAQPISLRDPHPEAEPSSLSSSSPPLAPAAAGTSIDSAPIGPTVAETGDPIAGTGGPVSGQLKPRRASNAEPIPLASFGSNDGSQLPTSVGSPPFGAAAGASFSASGSGIERMPTTSRQRLERAEQAIGGGGDELPAYDEGLGSEEGRANYEAEQILAAERERKQA